MECRGHHTERNVSAYNIIEQQQHRCRGQKNVSGFIKYFLTF